MRAIGTKQPQDKGDGLAEQRNARAIFPEGDPRIISRNIAGYHPFKIQRISKYGNFFSILIATLVGRVIICKQGNVPLSHNADICYR